MFLSVLYTFSDSFRNFKRFSNTNTNMSITISNYYKSTKSKVSTTFYYFSNTVDGNYSFF